MPSGQRRREVPAKVGRPQAITPEVAAAIVRDLGEAQTLKNASEANGVSQFTVLEYLRQGREDIEAGAATRFAQFAQDVARARARGFHLLHKAVMKSALVGDTVRVTEPLLDADGKPMRGPDGSALMRTTETPIRGTRDGKLGLELLARLDPDYRRKDGVAVDVTSGGKALDQVDPEVRRAAVLEAARAIQESDAREPEK